MMRRAKSHFLVEDVEETIRLEVKTDPEAVQRQAAWCGIKPGLRVLDAGCGPGKTTAILQDLIQPEGEILGMDYSEQRIRYAKEHYGQESGIHFQLHDLRDPLESFGLFDLIWARFVLEYNRSESAEIVSNLTASLRPGGYLCLIDLDHNSLNHFEMPAQMPNTLFELSVVAQEKYNFDPYAGRKLYAYLYDQGYEDIQVDLVAHHLIYGKAGDADAYNWVKKAEIASVKFRKIFEKYPGGRERFFSDFIRFFDEPRRFTYTPLILCKGKKPVAPSRNECD